MQVYKHMDIGSAKAGPEVTMEIPHHLMDVVSLREPFSAGEYYTRACRAIEVGISVESPCLHSNCLSL